MKNGKEIQTAGKKLMGVYCLFVLFSAVGDGPIMVLIFMSGSEVIREGCGAVTGDIRWLLLSMPPPFFLILVSPKAIFTSLYDMVLVSHICDSSFFFS